MQRCGRCVLPQEHPHKIDRVASVCGVSVRLLRAFLEQTVQRFIPEGKQVKTEKKDGLPEWCIMGLDGLTTKQVVEWIIKPSTADLGVRYADLLACEQEVGPPQYFVSHTWSRPFKETVGMVLSHLSSASDATRVWVDLFAINQHSPGGGTSELGQLAVTINNTEATLVCLDQDAVPLTRIWCLHEFDHTLRGGGDKLRLLLHTGAAYVCMHEPHELLPRLHCIRCSTPVTPLTRF
jgi:hypothetical protein